LEENNGHNIFQINQLEQLSGKLEIKKPKTCGFFATKLNYVVFFEK
jgi:hypothetical protein